jgi:hemerythrin
VGVKEIDEQHQRFFDLINAVSAARVLEDADKRLPHILEELDAYAKFHFSEEERCFDLFKYERAVAHKAEHRGYEQKVEEMKAAYSKGDKGLVVDLAEFMEEWLTNHISYSDKQYMKCFKEHGLR